MSNVWRSVLFILAFASLSQSALAHDPGLSTATVRLLPDKIEATVTFAMKDAGQLVELDSDHNGTVTREEFAGKETQLKTVAAENFVVRLDGQPVKPDSVRCVLDENDNVSLHLTIPHGTFSRFEVQSKFLAMLPFGHRQYFQLQKANGETMGEDLLSANADSISIHQLSAADLETPTQNGAEHSFLNFLELGVKHILTGYDHLLFLFALLLVTKNWLSSLKIITCFTMAHSITLALATFNVVQLPSRVVEPLIAASIIFVSVENLARGGQPKGRGVLTFAFGLIHGLGFASVLRELGVGENGSGVVLPLFSFNLGVELGQIAVTATVLPLLWVLRTKPAFGNRWAPACSVLIGLAGAYWLVQRVWFS